MVKNDEKSFIEALYELTEKERGIKKERAIIACIKTYGFAFYKNCR